MEQILCILFLLIPFVLQMKYGGLALAGWIKLSFLELTLLCFLLELALSFILFIFLANVFPKENGLTCGFGLAGMAIFGIPIAIGILFLATFQKIVLK